MQKKKLDSQEAHNLKVWLEFKKNENKPSYIIKNERNK